MINFIFNEKHVRDGLSDKDFSGYGGYPVKTFRLSDFPYWNELATSGRLLSSQLYERGAAIYAALQNTSLTQPNAYGRPFTLDDAYQIATYEYGTVDGITGTRVKMLYASERFRKTVQCGHFRRIIQNGVDSTINNIPLHPWWPHDKAPDVIVPGCLDEKMDIREVWGRYATYILRPSPDDAAMYWSRTAKLPKDRISDLPNDNLHVLLADLHEMRHVRQAYPISVKPLFRYYYELDADLFAHHILRQANIGQQTRIAHRHVRHLELLSVASSYWIAPAADALEAGCYPPNFFEVERVGREIRMRIAREAHGELQRVELNKMDKWNEDYTRLLHTSFRRTPEIICSLLRAIVEKNVFTNSLVRQTAQKIVEAAEYFNPALTQESNLRVKLASRSFG